MPTWSDVLKEIQMINSKNPLDVVRRKYLKIMEQYTGRNVIAYYSGFLQKPNSNNGIDDNDKNAFMQTVHGLDKSKGLDLILHTPGGGIAATESIVNYLKSIFGNNIRVFIPQMAMSAGTMIALSSKIIIMGKQSNIGPIDPQFGGVSCHGILQEFDDAVKDAKARPESIPLWQAIIQKYHPTFLGDCDKAIKWSTTMVEDWLRANMLKNDNNKVVLAQNIVSSLSNHSTTFSHDKHIHFDDCKKLGIKVKALESFEKKTIDNCSDLQDCVLTIHHAYMQTFSNSNAVKIVENHMGSAMIIGEGAKK